MRQGALLPALIWSGLTFAGMLAAMVWVPYQAGHAPGVASAASAAGYNNAVAHLVAVAWVVAAFVGALLWMPASDPLPRTVPQGEGRFRPVLPLLAVAGAFLLFFPPALALQGPHLEDSIHLTALHRMQAGDVPYRDFEFLYGPLMLYLPYWWMQITPFSLTTFYAYVAILEALVLILLLGPVQRHIRGFWWQVGAFIILAALVFNAKVGPNQNGLRWIAGALLLLSVARDPFRARRWVMHGGLLGLFLAYSQEFAAATAVGIAAIHLSLFVKLRDGRALMGLAVTALTSAMTWIATLALLLGPALPDYVTTVAYLTAQFDAGEAAFPYYWTLLGLMVFALIALGVWSAARVLRASWTSGVGMAELMAIGGVAYALLALKSGLNRADQWHLAPAAYVLAFAFLLPLGSKTIDLRRERRLGIALTLVLAASYSFGQFGIARYVFREELVAGYKAWLAGIQPPLPQVAPVLPATIYQNANPPADLIALANVLAQPENRGRPVFFHPEAMWNLGVRLGVRKMGYLADDFVYGDDRARDAWIRLTATPEALVVIRTDSYEWLKTPPGTPPEPLTYNLAGYGRIRALREVLTSVHIRAAPVERAMKLERWKTFVGRNLLSGYVPVYRSERFTVLEKGR